jgi:hypothetical protein
MRRGTIMQAGSAAYGFALIISAMADGPTGLVAIAGIFVLSVLAILERGAGPAAGQPQGRARRDRSSRRARS